MKRMYKLLMPLVALVAMALPATVQAQTTCTIKIVGEDGYGDGWNDGELAIVQGGTTLATFDAVNADDGGMQVGAYDSITVTVSSDSPVSFVWTSGTYDDEVTIWIYDGGGSLMYTVNEPTAGTIYTMSTPCPACLAPAGLAATVTNSDVDFAWTAGTGTSWEIVWGTGTFNPDTVTANMDYASTNTYTLSNLDDGIYTAYVRTDCGTDGYSVWTSVNFNIGFDVVNMATSGTDTLRTCNAIIYDNGGATGSYSNYCDATIILLPADATQWLSISGFSQTEGSYDYLTIYDGIGTSGEVLFKDNTSGDDSLHNFGPFTSSAFTISFHSDVSTTYQGFQVNASCAAAPACPRPTSFVASYVAVDSVELTWSDPINSNWVVVYGPAGFNPDTAVVNVLNVTDTTVFVDNLAANTQYDFYVAALCFDGDTTQWRMVSARTACAYLDTLPYIYGFEGATTGSSSTSSPFAATCWTRLNNGTSYGGYPYISNTSSYCHTGSRGLYWYNSTTTGTYGDYQCLVLPGVNTVDNPINGLQLKFWAKSSSTSTHPVFQVGVMTNPSDINSFEVVGTVNVEGTTWTEYETLLGNYTGTGRYVAVRALRPTSTWTAYVDDFTLEAMPTCPHPVDLVVDTVAPTEITVSWTAVGTETEWAVQVGDSLITGITDTTYTVTGLEQYTSYTLLVYAVCGADDTSTASAPVSARTTVSCPWPTNFTVNVSGDTANFAWVDAGASAWELVVVPMGSRPSSASIVHNPTTTSYQIDGLDTGFYDAYLRTDCGADGMSMWVGPVNFSYGIDIMNMATSGVDTLRSCAAIVYDNGGPTGQYSSSCSSTLVILPNTPGSDLIITGSSITESNYDYLRIYEGIGTSGTMLWTDYGVDALQNFGPFTAEAITVTFYSDGSVTRDGFQINVSCTPPSTCTRPSNFAVNSSIADSVVVSWNDPAAAGSYELAIGTPGFDPDTTSSSIPLTDSVYIFTNLVGGVTYDVYVRANCGSEYSNWSGPITFVPGQYIFGTSGSATISMCGGIIYDDGGPNGQYSNSTDFMLTIYPAYADSMLTFHGTLAHESCCDHLYIYEGVGDGGTLLWSDQSQATNQTIPLDTCTSGPLTIKWHADGSSTNSGFEIYINCVAAPTCSPVEALTVNPTPTAALITWTPGFYGQYTGATVEYKADTATDWTTMGTVTGTFTVIDGLDAGTDYNVRVLTDCDGFTGGMALTNFTTAEFGCAMIDSTLSHNDTVTGTATTSYSVPVNNFYRNTFSEQLYTATDLGAAGTISSFAFKYGYSTPMTAKTNCSVYMANTTLTGVTTSSYVAPETMTLVYSGSLNCTQGWNEFVMTTPFNYTGGTLAVAVVDNSNNYDGSSYVWNCHNISGMTMAWYSDSYTYPNSSMSKTTYTYRPDMIFKFLSCTQQATCAAPAAAVIDVTTTTVTVAWAPGNGEASWNAYYRLAGATAWSAPVAVTGNSYTFTGLNSGRNYEFKVENVCTEGSLTATVDAATLCAQISSLPFTEDFNGWGTGVTPNCWSNAPSYTPTSYGIISGSYNHSGTTGGSVYMYSSSTLTNKTYLILPELDTNVYQPNQLQLVFNLLHISTSYGRPAIEVGVMTDPGNASSFVAIDTVQHSGALNTWEVFEVPMSAYTGNGNYVAMRTAYDSAYSYFYLDDVTLEVIPTCLRPDSLTVSNATTSSVDLAWHERSNATSWVVEYGPSGFQPGTGTSVAASTNPFTLTGLPASYQGEYYVKSVCSSTDTGNYSYRPCAFNTTQIPATLPYNYDFEDSTEWANWQTCSNHTNNWFRGTAVADSGSYSIYMSADSGATYKPYLHNAVVNATAYRDIDFGTIDSSFTMTIRARAGGTTTGAYDGMIVLLADPSIATVPSSGNLMTPWGDVRNLYQIMDVRTDTTWQTYSCSFDTIHGVQRVAFYWFNQNTQGNSSYPNLGEPVAVDNIHIDYSSCPRPVDLQVTPSTTSAMLTWVGPASATYQISYRNINDTTIQNVIVNTNSHNLTGLVSPATYICSVRKICGNDTSFYSDAVRFTTLCAPQQLPFTETFNGVAGTDYSTAGNLPLCWEGYSNGTDNNYFPHVVAAGGSYVFSNDNTNAITLIGANYSTYGTTKVVALPIINADLSTCQISFYYAMENTSYGDLEVGYLTGSNMATDFVPVDTMTRTEDITCDTVSLANVPATALRLAFRWTQTGSSTWYSAGIDNVTVTGQAGPSCEAPTITAVTASDDNATVTWTAAHDSCYVAFTSGDWDNSVAGTLVLTGSYNMTNLTPNTNYTVGVRQRCDEGLYSDWITQNFTTADVPCLAVTGLTVVSTGFDNVTVSWVPTSVETAWNVRIYNTTMDTTVRSTDTVCTVTGLIRGVTYNVMVQPLCGSAATIEGPWCEATNFTTVECQPVTNVTTSNITNSSVKLSWTAAGSNDSEWRIEYGYAGFSRGEGQSVTATTNPYTLTGLERNTDYDVYVATVCEGNMLSSWSTVTSFTTDNNEGIDEATGESAVSLYPNPATSTVTIDQTMGRADITVIDMNGRTIGQWQATESSLTIDVSSMSKGTYFVRVTGEQATVVRKLVVK